jgi:hypothetical protein
MIRVLRSSLFDWLARRDVAAADHAAAAGNEVRSAQLLERADARLRKACHLTWVL